MATYKRFKEAFLALLVVGIWIPLICTLPHMLGNELWHRSGIESNLPLQSFTINIFNSSAVVLAVCLLRKTTLFKLHRTSKPHFCWFLIPLLLVNLLKGPLIELTLALFLVIMIDNFMTGFWEEFLFRGLVQERLSTLGDRWSMFLSSVMFALIHISLGWMQVLMAFAIGLTFSTLRDRIGMWPLVVAHFIIDCTHDLFQRQTTMPIGKFTMLIYMVVGLSLLFYSRKTEGTSAQVNQDDMND